MNSQLHAPRKSTNCVHARDSDEPNERVPIAHRSSIVEKSAKTSRFQRRCRVSFFLKKKKQRYFSKICIVHTYIWSTSAVRREHPHFRRGLSREKSAIIGGAARISSGHVLAPAWNEIFSEKFFPRLRVSASRVQDERSAIKSLKHALHIYRPLPSFYFFPPFLFSRFFSRLLARFRNEERNERCHDNYTECLNLADLWIRRKFRFVPRRDSLVEKFCSSSAAQFCSRCFPLLACDLINRSEQLPRKCSACCEQHLSWNIKLFFFSFHFPEEKLLRF